MTETITRLTLFVNATALKAYLSRHSEVKTQGTYFRQVWRTFRDYYNGEMDGFEFVDDMVSFIDNQFNRAWRQGAKDMGVDPRSFTDDDLLEIMQRIENEQQYILTVATAIDHARLNNAGVSSFRVRAEMWANRFNEIVSAAHTWFGGRQLLEWELGPTVEHCTTCATYSGIVARAADWQKLRAIGIFPQSPNLECHGFKCQCSLHPTKKPPTEGGIPGLA